MASSAWDKLTAELGELLGDTEWQQEWSKQKSDLRSYKQARDRAQQREKEQVGSQAVCPFADQRDFRQWFEATTEYKRFARASGKQAKKLGKAVLLAYHPDKFSAAFPKCDRGITDDAMKQFTQEYQRKRRQARHARSRD